MEIWFLPKKIQFFFAYTGLIPFRLHNTSVSLFSFFLKAHLNAPQRRESKLKACISVHLCIPCRLAFFTIYILCLWVYQALFLLLVLLFFYENVVIYFLSLATGWPPKVVSLDKDVRNLFSFLFLLCKFNTHVLTVVFTAAFKRFSWHEINWTKTTASIKVMWLIISVTRLESP